jgi:hypothetical protein
MFRFNIGIDKFLSALEDFFINPNIILYSIDKETEFLINFLQNTENAK